MKKLSLPEFIIIVLGIVLLGFVVMKAMADTQAICTPVPPSNAVLINETKCTIVSGSPQISVTIHVPVVVPKNPSDTTAAIFGVSSSRDFTVLSPVGTIAVGVACDGSQQIIMGNTHYYIVPSLDKSVTWTGTPRIRVYAICA